jgi:argininosuccinate lyase
MDIRGPRLRKPSDEALAFTSSMAWDGRIARHVVGVNMAHMAALVKAGEVERRVGAKCMKFLMGASSMVDPEGKAEDYHQQLEQDAVDALGVETAGFLNFGKSRNDQVATAIRMELRERVLDLVEAIAALQQAFLDLASKRGTVLIPGYTHLQRAQPVTLAHHLMAHFDALQRDTERALQLYERVNLSPMGAAAMAGTSVKLDREAVATSLGFSGIVRNAMDAVASRDGAIEALSCATMTTLDGSRLAEELILWSSAEFGFVELSDAYSASSSIMPQKKNAVFAEISRAKAGSVLGNLTAACAIMKALPYSYNLDLQEVTPQLWRAMDDSIDSLKVLAGAVASLEIRQERLETQISDDNSTAVGLANYLVREHGLSFRQAHAIVGELVRISVDTGAPLQEVSSSRMPKVSAKLAGKRVTIDKADADRILGPQHFLEAISTEGGSNPKFMPKELNLRQGQLLSTRTRLSQTKATLRASQRKLNRKASGIAREVKTRIER